MSRSIVWAPDTDEIACKDSAIPEESASIGVTVEDPAQLTPSYAHTIPPAVY